jgi:D-alanyl-lipoteichoic acid acyltransferase DltB (MBOAT superfamily)
VLWIGIIFNVGILCYFKYYNFFLDVASNLVPLQAFHINVTIPLGISFYTFTQLTYLVDLYQGKARYYGIVPYSLFVIFFPHLIAGPIVHYSQMMPQFNRIRTYISQQRNFFLGIFFFIVGLFQKVVIADSLISVVDTGFANAHLLNFIEAWSTLLAFSLQIYFDFAGYSNMAIGLGLFFNIRFPMNFNSPYQAVSLIDFWRRWHMTLSRFLRDYLYIPLGGNRLGNISKYKNLLVTFLIGGLWHGAAWTYIVWGAYHGIILALNHFLEDIGVRISGIPGRILTFFIVIYGWVFFRAQNMSEAFALTRSLFRFQRISVSNTYFLWKYQACMIIAALMVALFFPNAEFWARKVKPVLGWGMLFALVFATNLLFLNRESVFLYFQF